MSIESVVAQIRQECLSVNVDDVNSVEMFIEHVDEQLSDLCQIVDGMQPKKKIK